MAAALAIQSCQNYESTFEALLTDLYQITMCYGYWKSGKYDENAVFDLFFRKNPFNGEFTLFGGLGDCLEFIERFRFNDADIEYLRSILPKNTESGFFDYLRSINCTKLRVWAITEGTVVFPRVPLLVLEGPLAVCQLLETPLLNLVNYASLVCTNAARFRLAAGPRVQLLEFGLRRAQGPNGGLTASKYCYIGGFDGTSNVLAGKLFKIPVKGTHAHSFVNTFRDADLADLSTRHLFSEDGLRSEDFVALAQNNLDRLCAQLTHVVRTQIHKGELAAFIAYALAFPCGFLALVDTYDTLRSGVVNFSACAMALHSLGYEPLGVRLDSGDLAYLSKEIRRVFAVIADAFDAPWFRTLIIVASNDISEETLYSLKEQGHEVNSFGVGTHLVTCQKQPALGCVYKLVSVNAVPKIKLSQEVDKVTMPGKKKAFRLFGRDGCAINDLILLDNEPAPIANIATLCRHPFQENKRAYVTPTRVMALHDLYYEFGERTQPRSTLDDIRANVANSLKWLRDDYKRYLNPTPYKVSVSEKLYGFIHDLWLEHAPVGQLE